MEADSGLLELSQRIADLEQSVHQRLTLVEQQVAGLAGTNPVAAIHPTATPVPQAPPGAPTFLPATPPQPSAPGQTTSMPSTATPQAPLPLAPPPPRDLHAEQEFYAEQHRNKAAWDIETILRWVGVGLVVLAGLFLVSTAINRGWITPEMQLVGAGLIGAGLLGASVHFSELRREWTLAMGLGGTVILTASATASHAWRMMVSPELALLLIAIAFGSCVAVAIRTRMDPIGALAGCAALIGGGWLFPDIAAQLQVFWVLAIVLTTSALGLAQQWPATRLITGWFGAFAMVGLCFAAGDGELSQGLGAIGLVLSAVVLWLGPNIAEKLGAAGPDNTTAWRPFDLRTLAAVPSFTWLGLIGLGTESGGNGAGYAALAVALFFGLLAAGCLSTPVMSKVAGISTLLGASGLFAVGLGLVLDGPALMIALAAQAVTSFVLGRILEDQPMRWTGYALGCVASMIALGQTFLAIDDGGFDSATMAIATFLIGTMWAGAAFHSYRNGDTTSPGFTVPFLGAWIGLGIWLVAALLVAPQGLSLVSVAWALMAGIALIIGLTERLDLVRMTALWTLAATLIKLFTLDLAGVGVLARVALFFVLGVGLILLGLKVPSLVSSDRPEANQLPDGESADHDAAGPQLF